MRARDLIAFGLGVACGIAWEGFARGVRRSQAIRQTLENRQGWLDQAIANAKPDDTWQQQPSA